MSSGIRPEDLPADFRLRNQAALGKYAGILQLTEAEVKEEMEPRAPEKSVQDRCEKILMEKGYDRLTAINCAEEKSNRSGWFGHLFEPRRNPLMPDLFIYDAKMKKPPLMVELKVREEYRAGQAEMIARGCWQVCRSATEFRNVLECWEKQIR